MQDLEPGLSNLCRLCGEVDIECTDLFDEKSQKDDLLSKIQISIRILITENDGLPTGICNMCQEKLVDYSSFYQQCHDTQERLQEFLSIESAVHKSVHRNQPVIKVDVNEEEDESDEFYYEDAEGETEDVGVDHTAEFMETEESQEIPEEEYIPTDAEKDTGSFAAPEREKTLPVRNSTPGQEKDAMQPIDLTLSNSKQVGERNPLSLESSAPEDLVVIPLNKDVDDSETYAAAPICKVQSVVSVASGSSSFCTQTSNSLVPSSEPPPLVKIVQKSIVKPFPFKVPPLVPIKNILPLKPTAAPSATIVATKIASPVIKAAPPTTRVPVVKLTRLSESTLTKFVKGYSPKPTKASEKITSLKSQPHAMRNEISVSYPSSVFKNPNLTGALSVAKNNLLSEPPPLVRRLATKAGMESLSMARKGVALELPSVTTSSGAKGRVFIVARDKSLLNIPKTSSPRNEPQKTPKKVLSPSKKMKLDPPATVNSSASKKKKLNPLVTASSSASKKKKSDLVPKVSSPSKKKKVPNVDSSRAEELSLAQTDKPDLDKVTKKKKKKKKKLLPPYKSVPYLVLKNGQLVKLDEVETVPFAEIPIPPVIVMHVSRDVTCPPKIAIEGQINFPDISSYSGTFPVDLGSGLHVRAYPETYSKEFTVSTPGTPIENANSSSDHLLVVQNKWLRQHKKKGIFVRKANKRNRPSTCPETALHIEEQPFTDPPSYKCKVCNVSFIHRKACEYHIINKHMTEICAYQCKECGKKFATNFLRASHIRHRHVRSPDLICSICGAAFRSVEVLKGHELRHSVKDPPFKCGTCGKGFYTKANRLKHELWVHGEKKVICDICGEAFPSGGRLNEHRLTHTGGFKCKECGKVVNTRNKLRTHKAKFHMKDETFMLCPCGKKFRIFAFLHNHRKVCATYLQQSAEGAFGNDNAEELEYFGDNEEGGRVEVFQEEVLQQ